MSQEEQNQIKIGELLVGAGVVSTGDIVEAIQIAKRMNLPIGRVMIMSGCLSETNLNDGLEAQQLIREGALTVDTAYESLKICFARKISLNEALERLDWKPQKGDLGSVSKLGGLLVDSNLVSQDQLDRALKASFTTGVPLGGTLVLQGLLSAQLLPAILNTQEKLRDGKISRQEAVDEMKSAVLLWASAERSKLSEFLETDTTSQLLSERAIALAPLPSPPPALTGSMPLKELLQLSGFYMESNVQAAIKNGLSDPRILPRLLVVLGLIDQQSMESCLRCLSLMEGGLLKPEEAVAALTLMRNRRSGLDEALRDLGIALPG